MTEEEDTYTDNPEEFVPNYGRMDKEDKIKTTEMIYRKQMIHKWGWIEGEHPEDVYHKRRKK